MDNTSFFLLVSFGRFQRESYASVWGHYGSKIMGVFSRPLSKALSLIIDILRWYNLSLYGGLCPICFSRESGYGDSIFVF